MLKPGERSWTEELRSHVCPVQVLSFVSLAWEQDGDLQRIDGGCRMAARLILILRCFGNSRGENCGISAFVWSN